MSRTVEGVMIAMYLPTDARTTAVSRGRKILCAALGVLTLLNMIVIFCFSAEPQEKSGDRSEGITQTVVSVVVDNYEQLTEPQKQEKVQEFHPIIRKLAHFSEFALLGFLTGAFMLTLGKTRYFVCWIAPAAFCLVYAASDEIHQIFTNRGPAVTDVLIDFSGSALGLLLIHAAVLIVCAIRGKRREGKGNTVCEPPTTT